MDGGDFFRAVRGLRSLAPTCPHCGSALSLDPALGAPTWRCAGGHSFASTRALVRALRERGREPSVARRTPPSPPPA